MKSAELTFVSWPSGWRAPLFPGAGAIAGAAAEVPSTKAFVASPQPTESTMFPSASLIAEPIARDRLAAAERNAATARERTTALEEQNRELERNLSATRAELEQTKASHGTVSRELADIRTASANVVKLHDDNASLQQRLVQRDLEVEQLTMENTRLTARSNQTWFVVGAAVLLGGIVVGLVAPSLRRKRRSDW